MLNWTPATPMTDATERLVPLPVPEPDSAGALPISLAKDGVVVLSYKAFVNRTNAHVIVTFHPAVAHRVGPLAGRGLKPDRAYEVENSGWARVSFGGKGTHFLFTFQDSVFECVAAGYGAETTDEDDDAVRLMARRLYK